MASLLFAPRFSTKSSFSLFSPTKYPKYHPKISICVNRVTSESSSYTYYLQEKNLHRREISYNLSYSLSYTSKHKEFLEVLPKDLTNITAEEFRRAVAIIKKSMRGLRCRYFFHIFITFIYAYFISDLALILFIIYILFIPKLLSKHLKKIEKFRYMQEINKNEIPIPNIIVELINIVRESDYAYLFTKISHIVLLFVLLIIVVRKMLM